MSTYTCTRVMCVISALAPGSSSLWMRIAVKLIKLSHTALSNIYTPISARLSNDYCLSLVKAQQVQCFIFSVSQSSFCSCIFFHLRIFFSCLGFCLYFHLHLCECLLLFLFGCIILSLCNFFVIFHKMQKLSIE